MDQVRDLLQGRAPVLHVLAALALAYGGLLALPRDGGGLTAIGVGVISLPLVLLCVRKIRQQLSDSAGLPGAMLLVLGLMLVLLSGVLKAIGALTPSVPAYTPYQLPPPKVTVERDAFLIKGEIEYRILSELKGLTARHPDIRLVVLNSGGGHAQAGRAIGLFITRQKLATRVDAQCYSACTLAFAGGVQRSLGPSGRLGFHGYRQDSHWRPVTLNIEEVEAKDREFLKRQGFGEAFLKRAYRTPPDQVWLPERAELLRSGVLTPEN